jgi:hypothetical protein
MEVLSRSVMFGIELFCAGKLVVLGTPELRGVAWL